MEVSEIIEKRKSIIDKVNAEFEKYEICSYAEAYYKNNDVIVVDVDGDWKHDHLATRDIMIENGCISLGQKEIGESDDDSYHAEHYYKI